MVFFRAHDLPQEEFDDIIHKPKCIYVHGEHMKPLMVDSTDYCAEEQRSYTLLNPTATETMRIVP